ncbi:hypothetical protein G3N55_00920 [Dissulfurirhabdus thermomarina]|uniref:HAMP domain-containing protein n=1 Tax=Dissulfurirhabdus thermomarina TaxID=1765737 RepID=A0A6N9TNU1_DISTH|nr:hypothetical protein [Dissulfurirhabdus thermomarina]NDY41414.1 hypothetical protein [Dissulfurirhabdus thermomarina]NMX24402.1 hypothetical protein [Dissulfurirhabdus thermomarina]
MTGRDRAVFALRLAALALAGVAGTAVGLYLALDRGLGGDYATAFSVLDEVTRSLRRLLAASAAVQAGLLGAVFLPAAIWWTHRVAGPLHRFRALLRALGPAGSESRRLGPFRGNDRYREIPRLWNAGLIRWEWFLRSAAGEIRAIGEALPGTGVNAAALAEVRERLDRLVKEMERHAGR